MLHDPVLKVKAESYKLNDSVLRVPEEKSYMILPEIEEEEEEGQKLSLTSLLLGDSSATVLYK